MLAFICREILAVRDALYNVQNFRLQFSGNFTLPCSAILGKLMYILMLFFSMIRAARSKEMANHLSYGLTPQVCQAKFLSNPLL